LRLSNGRLHGAVAAHRVSADVETRSEIDNLCFEERVNGSRQGVFEEEVGEVETWEDLRRRHIDYHRSFVQVGDGLLPHTFMRDFVVRDLSLIDEKQKVVRIESIARPLSASALSLARMEEALANGERDIIDLFLRTWNDSAMRDARPAFATLKSAVAAEIGEADWPERLRDRLGLAHYDAAAGPEPIALMEYRVEELIEAARNAGAECAVTAPTVLDSGPWPHFFPAPTELDCGRAMALFEIDSDENLVIELLHVRLIYQREHIMKLGEIRSPPRPIGLARLRNHHLTALRLASGRYDFGEEMPEYGLATA
jgi:hypothetical protein